MSIDTLKLTFLTGFSGQGGTIFALIAVFSLVGIFLRRWPKERHLWQIPGPRLYAISSIPLALNAWDARSIHTIHQLHKRYGPVVRVTPTQISFNSLSALRTIYGAGSPFERTDFYKMFDVYGRPNLFTFASGQQHRDRKKLLSHMYANQTVLGSHYSDMVVKKVAGFFAMLDKEPAVASEIFASLHYFSLDAISEFVYGAR
jgi:Cytochrome P450